VSSGVILPPGAMQRKELARALARQARISRAAAQDRVDERVYKILQSLRKGRSAEIPGVGTLVRKIVKRNGSGE
jgi:nucleoid DNA-binding protein